MTSTSTNQNIIPILLLAFLPMFSFSQQLFNRVEHLIGLENMSLNNGVAVADYDQDNDLDIFVVFIETDDDDLTKTKSRLYRNNNDGTFTDVTEEAGIGNILRLVEVPLTLERMAGLYGYKYGSSWGDFDNDGFPDLFLTSRGKLNLFHNNGNGTFTDITDEAGILQYNNCANTGATWFDYNNDRLLDLYIADWEECEFNTLYKNNGDGTFTNVSTIISDNIEGFLASYNALPFDFNQDGWMDLYVTNDLYKPNHVFINNNGINFTEMATSLGLANAKNDMGIGVADYNNDSFIDFFITETDNNILHKNNGDNTFSDETIENNLGASGWSWGASFTDYDLDGDEDLFIANGFEYDAVGPQTNEYYENLYQQSENTFEKTSVGVEHHASSVEGLNFDYDNDGDIDLLVTNTDKESFFYENQIINQQEQNESLRWIKIMLEGTLSNRDAIGTMLTIETDQGKFVRYYTGVGFLGQSLRPVHFGFPENTTLESLTIDWPSGHQDQYTTINANTHVKAIENQGLTEININPAVKTEGCTDPNSCNYNEDAVIDDNSCEYLQDNGSITGASSTSFFKQEDYSYPLPQNYSMTWQVEGGEIIESSSEETITVKWGFEEQGKIIAVLNNDDCFSEEIEFNVNLGISNLDSHISVARLWNEAVLFSIRNDFARPPVHARNLFHTSAAMYDAWAIFNNNYRYLIGNEVNGFTSDFTEFPIGNIQTQENLEETISYAAYRIIKHRFRNSPKVQKINTKINSLMAQLGYSTSYTSTMYENGDPAALGNYIAETYINFGLSDGSNEQMDYENLYYEPINLPLAPILAGNPTITDPDRWQSLSLDTYIDQSGNIIEGTSIDFLSPEWGNVYPFAMTEEDAVTHERDGNPYIVYNDPGQPTILNSTNLQSAEAYQWGFSLVSVWSAHLDPFDGVMWDISPASIGNISINDYPDDYTEYAQFYNLEEGGTFEDQGRSVNPITGQPYEPQIVPRGDYTRILAEFWADGPDSETPPGHWYVLLNTVNDSPFLERKFKGQGEELNPLEWDVKSYFTLGGAMHDAAISAWSIKGYYDYIRPISAIRYMADRGQSTDPNLPNFHQHGIPLIEGFIELVQPNEDLAGQENEHVGKVKLLAWKGHDFIGDTETEQAGVDWILAEKWWPYQRPSFVTPPFAGYVSGHSTYSRAAADILTYITGSEYFPGGLGEFVAPKNEFLVFEEGPSVDVILQWATYQDASDQCSLSRIWGGIHPPIDDIPGRKIGEKVGKDAFDKAISYFQVIPEIPSTPITSEMIVYPNPITTGVSQIHVSNSLAELQFRLFDIHGRPIAIEHTYNNQTSSTEITVNQLASGVYILSTKDKSWKLVVQ